MSPYYIVIIVQNWDDQVVCIAVLVLSESKINTFLSISVKKNTTKEIILFVITTRVENIKNF